MFTKLFNPILEKQNVYHTLLSCLIMTYLSGPAAGGLTLAGSLSGASTILAEAGVDIFTIIGIPIVQNTILYMSTHFNANFGT